MKANQKFNLTEKQGFACESPVSIYKNGELFYSFPKATTFNLPAGKNYISNVDLKKAPLVKYDFKRERKPERSLPIPEKITVSFGVNPNKATIFLDQNRVLLDNKFKSMGEVAITHVLYHEIAHYLYTTEEFCDEYAQERMLEEGFNLSQILEAVKKTFPAGHERTHYCENNVKNKARIKNGKK